MEPADRSTPVAQEKPACSFISTAPVGSFLLLEVSALQACAESGAAHLTPERGRGRQQHREGLVAWLPCTLKR